jgi:hypothetical protein
MAKVLIEIRDGQAIVVAIPEGVEVEIRDFSSNPTASERKLYSKDFGDEISIDEFTTDDGAFTEEEILEAFESATI